MTKQYPNVSLPDSRLHTLSSSFVDHEFNIFVSLPTDYSSTQHSYPVLYLLDANLCIGTTTEIVHAAPLAQELPEMLVVGIGYPVKYYPEMIPFRDQDYTSTNLRDVENSGGAANFLKFIQTELMPFINNAYRTNVDDQTIMGYSLSALFAFYSLFHQPELFNRYLVISPAINWDEKNNNEL